MVDNWYAPDHDTGILWIDPSLQIDWQINIDDIILSEKDKKLQPLEETTIPLF